jgi:hypothetical protein
MEAEAGESTGTAPVAAGAAALGVLLLVHQREVDLFCE